jgi:hypothetical protein
MLYLDALLRRGAIATQKEAFHQPYGQFVLDSALAYYVFSCATSPPIRIRSASPR